MFKSPAGLRKEIDEIERLTKVVEATMNCTKDGNELKEAQDEVKRLTRIQLEKLVAAYSDPANFSNGVPYLPEN
jgi:hypothetical protein